MDWNSPTTKKHIAEAKAQGCELLGAGSKKGYRTYQLACGHEKEVHTTCMRSGGFRCQTCLENRLIEEAEAQGCELIGSGKSVACRTYRLSCGHEKEVRTDDMRRGNFRCQTCQNNKLIEEAEAQGCELQGAGRNAFNRTYRLPCGHEKEVGTGDMRRGNFRCQICFDKKLQEEAEAQDCELLGAGRTRFYGMYRLPCGHELELRKDHIRSGGFRCQTCLDNKLIEEAKAQGCVLLGAASKSNNRTYQLPCGHKQEVNTTRMRIGNFGCQTCQHNKLAEEAEAQGCVLLGAGKTADFRTYQLTCGHEQEVRIDAMRIGSFLCQICEEWAFTQPSKAYLLHIKVGPDEWLKLGYAKNVDHRVTRYGLPPDSEVSVLQSKDFDTGKDAKVFEQSLHKKYKRKRLSAADMADFHSKSGQTECYPVLMVHRLMAEFRQRDAQVEIE